MKSVDAQAPSWTIRDSLDLYGIDDWASGYFGVNSKGQVTVKLRDDGKDDSSMSLESIVKGLVERGLTLPVLLRFPDLLHARIRELNRHFQSAINEMEYQGAYRGVYPIKVNQQQHVIEEITRFGEAYHYGLEAGSKAELIAALAYMRDPQAYLICNGYKDEEFVDLALRATRMGIRVVLVLEMPGELNLILDRSEALGIEPVFGIRARLTSEGTGYWEGSTGDHSVFGLGPSQVMDVIDTLRQRDALHNLQLLHYHQGSQIPDIRSVREAANEGARIYVELMKEGAAMGILDLGGGLAVDYDGSHSQGASSSNYGLNEYCVDIVEIIKRVSDEAGVPHPTLVTESGRAIAAYFSVLVFDVLDTSSLESAELPASLPNHSNHALSALYEVESSLNQGNLQECYNDADYYRDQLKSLFLHGNITLRERALGEKMYWYLVTRIARLCESMEEIPEPLENIRNTLIHFYYGNFSVFQSLPDAWAIDQMFPVIPIHRLDTEPTRRAVLSDITCDCDGKLNRFIQGREHSATLAVHETEAGSEYLMGVFLIGAYQETLGDLHNLLGDTNVVSVEMRNGKPHYSHEVDGDSVSDVLSYVEYDPKTLVSRFRLAVEEAVATGRITTSERRALMNAYQNGLRGYTYYKQQ